MYYQQLKKNQTIYDFFPTVMDRLVKHWFRPTWLTLAFITGHGRLFEAWLQ